jgi:hypothetical protein
MLLMAGHHSRPAPSVKAARRPRLPHERLFARVGWLSAFIAHRRETESLYRWPSRESAHTPANP